MDRDVYIRNHIVSILVGYSWKGLDYATISELADAITQAVLEADDAWQADSCCEQVVNVSEDIPQ